MAANEMRIFSTGKIRIGDVGGSLTDNGNGITLIQNLSIEPSFEEKKLFTTAWINRFAQDVGFYGADLKVKFEVADVERDLIRRISGGTLATVSAVDTITIAQTSYPSFFRLEIDAETNEASPRMVNIVVFKAFAKAVPISLKLDDFGMIQVECSCLPDPGTGNVCTIAMAQ